MTEVLENLEPKLLWKQFVMLCRIPRGSQNERAAADYVLSAAARLGLKAVRDTVGNVVVSKPASLGKESAPILVLQSHLDMVCEKDEWKTHDFEKDPISLVRDGEYVKADGTTLGADNGVGVASMLAVMESSAVVHGPLEFLFTTEEETGLTGAFHIDTSLIKGKRLLNLDSEEEGTVYIGCAGGMESVATRQLTLVEPSEGKSSYRLKVSGLKGGHSGLDIFRGRGNAIQILARILKSIVSSLEIEIVSLNGGSKRNAIPREAFAQFFMNPSRGDELQNTLGQLQAVIRAELGVLDPEVLLGVEEMKIPSAKVWENNQARQIVAFLRSALHGTLAMDTHMTDLVQSSTNLAIVETKGERISIVSSHRSSIDSAKKDVADRFSALCLLAELEAKHGNGYPGWNPNMNSLLLAAAKKCYSRILGQELRVKAIHAGLECGVLGDRFPGMDTLSMGPTIENAHSPQERVHIPSVAKFWGFLVGLLAAD